MATYTHKVILNWYGELHTLYTTASSGNTAFRNAQRQLAKKLQVLPYKVRQYYNRDIDNVKVERRQSYGRNSDTLGR